MSVPAAAAPALQPNITYRVESDFAPIIKASVSYNVLVVNPAVQAHSLAEMVALIRSTPDQLTFSSGGFGTPAHLIGELFKLQTGARATHVPYQVFPQAIGDLLNGTNQFMFITMLPVVDLIKTGRLRAIAVTAPQRVAALAEVPTVAEQGFASLIVEDWVGFAARRGTSPEVVARLNEAFNQALKEASVREALQKLGAAPAGGTAEEFGDYIRSQVTLWRRVIVDSGIKM
jgi:tripartite-type tricarboxylate transporter receptor subunit TctC